MTEDRARHKDLAALRLMRGRPWIGWSATTFVLILAAGVVMWQINGLATAADDQAAQTAELRRLVEQVCQPIARDPEARERVEQQDPDAAEVCRRVERGEVPGPPGERGAQGPPPSDKQVREAVEQYFEAHPPQPGRPPTAVEIAAAVINYLRANPPAPGRPGPPPTAEQVADAVERYLQATPPPAGPAGPAGRAPTAEEIATAVREYIQANPLPTCPDGTQAEPRTVLTVQGPTDAVICVRA